MSNDKKLLGLCVALSLTACVATGCNDDVTQPSSCDDVTCDAGQVCDPVSLKCVDDTPVTEDKCKDVTCDEGQTCNKDTGKCEGGSTEPPKQECENGLTECSGACYDLTSDNNNCGECGKICSEGESCKDSKCEVDFVAECEDSEAPICEGNNIKKCVNGKYEIEECGELTCDGGACKEVAECDDSFTAICEGNAVKSCKNGKFDIFDCGNKACDGGECSDEEFVKECEDDMAPACDAESNSIKTCQRGKFVLQNCGTLTCDGGECKDVAECDDTFAAVCEGNGIKSCKDGKFVTEACGDAEICVENACKPLAIDDLCPDDENKKGPGVCGCGISDDDLDLNGVVDCLEIADLCPDDPDKTLPGICGCGIPDTLNESTGNPLCLESGKDLCPDDEHKTMPGICGCGLPDTVDELSRQPLCLGVKLNGKNVDMCASSDKYVFGTCGCDNTDNIDDATGIPACVLAAEDEDLCPNDPEKTRPGICGCGVDDQAAENIADSDEDGVPDCIDQCPNNPYKYVDDACDCSEVRVRLDGSEFCAIPITTAEQFVDLVKTANNAQNYAIMKDINLYDWYESTAVDWVGINNFRGKLVSTGKTISFANGNTPGKLTCNASCGLFKSMSNARIHNLKLDLNIESKAGTTGLLAGSASGSTITSVEVKGNVKGAGNYVGGVVGNASSTTLSNIKHTGDVTASANSCVGGIAGAASGVISSVQNNGKVDGLYSVGGIVGSMSGPISDALNEGSITGRQYMGGIVASTSGKLTNLTNKADITGNEQNNQWGAYVGGIVGALGGIQEHSNLVNYGNITFKGGTHWNCGIGGIAGNTTGSNNSSGLKFTNVHNHGDLLVNSWHSSGAVIGYSYGGISLENVSNSGSFTCEGNNNCSDMGGILGTWMTFVDNSNVASSKKEITNTFVNVLNTGAIKSKGGYVGGIVGNFRARGENATLTMTNIVNRGDVTGSSSVGGIFGIFGCSGKICTLTDAYSTGNISGGSSIGGIIGGMSNNSPSWNNFQDASDMDRANSFVINRAYSTGNITGSSSSVGGLIGSADTALYAKKLLKGSNGSLKLTCSSDSSQTTSVGEVWHWYNSDHTLQITNAYTTGTIKGSSSVGGLIGSLPASSSNANITIKDYAYDDSCNLVTTETVETVRRTGKVVIANVFSAAAVEGSSTFGGLIGNYSYSNSLDAKKYAHIMHNGYATGMVSANGGAIFGNTPANVNYDKLYFWPNASGAQYVTPSNAAISGFMSFSYVSGIPHVDEIDVDLVNQLNANIKASNSSELGKDVSATWSNKDHNISPKLDVTIPFLDIAPAEFEWEKEDSGNGSEEEPRV